MSAADIEPGDTIVVTIGRNVRSSSSLRDYESAVDGQLPMIGAAWRAFQHDTQTLLRRLHQTSVWGPFLGSGEWDGVREESAAFLVAVEDRLHAQPIVQALRELARRFDQEAIAFSWGPTQLVTANRANPIFA